MRLGFEPTSARLVSRLRAAIRQKAQHRLDEAWARRFDELDAAGDVAGDRERSTTSLDTPRVSRRISFPYRP